jgi:hypothetical protein
MPTPAGMAAVTFVLSGELVHTLTTVAVRAARATRQGLPVQLRAAYTGVPRQPALGALEVNGLTSPLRLVSAHLTILVPASGSISGI